MSSWETYETADTPSVRLPVVNGYGRLHVLTLPVVWPREPRSWRRRALDATMVRLYQGWAVAASVGRGVRWLGTALAVGLLFLMAVALSTVLRCALLALETLGPVTDRLIVRLGRWAS